MDAVFLKLLHQHQGIINKVCCIYLDSAVDREDLFQEITLQAWKSFASFREDAQFSTWLYRVALNTALTYFKKEKKRHLAESEWKADTHCFMQPQEDPQLQAMYRSITRLNPVEKALVALYLEDYDYQHISEILGITPNHVAVKMNRIKNKLRTESQKYIE